MKLDRITGISAIERGKEEDVVDYERDVPPSETATEAWTHFETWLRSKSTDDEVRLFLFIRLAGGWSGGVFIDLMATVCADGSIAVGENSANRPGNLARFFRVLAGLPAFPELMTEEATTSAPILNVGVLEGQAGEAT